MIDLDRISLFLSPSIKQETAEMNGDKFGKIVSNLLKILEIKINRFKNFVFGNHIWINNSVVKNEIIKACHENPKGQQLQNLINVFNVWDSVMGLNDPDIQKTKVELVDLQNQSNIPVTIIKQAEIINISNYHFDDVFVMEMLRFSDENQDILPILEKYNSAYKQSPNEEQRCKTLAMAAIEVLEQSLDVKMTKENTEDCERIIKTFMKRLICRSFHGTSKMAAKNILQIGVSFESKKKMILTYFTIASMAGT